MADDDHKYVEWLRKGGCALAGNRIHQCGGSLDIHHHTGRRGMGTRASDRDAFPLCHRHHMSFHGAYGLFKGNTKEQRRRWQDDTVAFYRARYEDKDMF